MNGDLASFPAFGVDTVLELSVADCRYLVRQNYAFVVRYLGRVSADELLRILCSGLAFMPVTRSRKSGWSPSASLGVQDGEEAVAELRKLSLPKCTVWLDLEGSGGAEDETSMWVNAWSRRIVDAGYEAGLYVGANAGLNAQQLWELPHTTRYWRACSMVPEPANRGFCMFQLAPHNQRVGPVIVDVNAICADWKGAKPTWVAG